jgi:serine/threonine-protein kinase
MASVCFGRQIGAVGFWRVVAIKRLHPHVAREPEFVQMFLDEARLATRIHNAHVVQTLDVVAAGGELLLVMEYVHGEALSKLLTTTARRGERVEPKIAVAIATGILEGLHAAHEARSDRGVPLQIVHRDVSPQNVLVGTDGLARVFDFGIAKAADRLHTTQDGSLKGKLAYMAPEQLENREVDRRADIWAASVVLWEMLAGRRLFVADSQAALSRAVLKREIPPPSSMGLPAKLDPVLARGLARDPNTRFATAREMALALEDALPPAPARMVGSWVERNASEELDARARMLEEVSGRAAEERPSGATQVEVAALIQERNVRESVTTAVAHPLSGPPHGPEVEYGDEEQTTAFRRDGSGEIDGEMETPRTAPEEARAGREAARAVIPRGGHVMPVPPPPAVPLGSLVRPAPNPPADLAAPMTPPEPGVTVRTRSHLGLFGPIVGFAKAVARDMRSTQAGVAMTIAAGVVSGILLIIIAVVLVRSRAREPSPEDPSTTVGGVPITTAATAPVATAATATVRVATPPVTASVSPSAAPVPVILAAPALTTAPVESGAPSSTTPTASPATARRGHGKHPAPSPRR